MGMPLLALSTSAATTDAGATVTIDGAPYRLRTRATLSVAQRLRFPAVMDRFSALHAAISADTATEAEDAEFRSLLADVAVMAIAAPPELVRSLDFDAQLVVVSVAFFGFRPGGTTPAPAATKRRAKKKTTRRGATSSRG